MALIKRIKAWQILRIMKRYQKKFPAEVEPKLGPGRIALAQRVEFNKKAIRTLVRDKKLAELIISRPSENWRQKEAITEYALKKAEGDKQKAINFLKEAQREIDKVLALGLKTIADGEVKKKAGALQGNEKEYAKQSRHMYGTPFQLGGLTLEYCIIKIKQMK